ncbi:hypothetical protein [Lonepinella sp. BR2271]|uniref:hypothetical protein n=1 Tax=Lonepinella sp. BR2271 TaxID=3434550 RepID=UPI003F6DDC77
MYDVSLKRKWDEYSLLSSATRKGIAQGIEQGIEQGLQKGLQSTAQNMLNRGFDIQLVSEIVGLPVEDIQKLRQTLN